MAGLDADLLGGLGSSWYSAITDRLGYVPVTQGGGAGQGANRVYIGWGAGSRLRAQVDGSDLGNIVFDFHVTDVWRSSNDGSGSGLDADLLDGRHASDFALISDFSNQSLEPTGWQRMPGGLIRQWGEAIVTDSSGVTNVVFPVAFPNRCLSAQATNLAAGIPAAWAGVGSFTRNGMLVGHAAPGGGPAGIGTAARWEAIGH
ncbi:hypothetical protein ACFSGX_03840 [Sphingomonas arantia]|uniref:Putative tail fiber protein gp53-like C-terminal domain-containing protein n=1 Tax=Sphingomonas arantia TaxID=1460676 RepID=A0ABW4TVG5_9SPHN